MLGGGGIVRWRLKGIGGFMMRRAFFSCLLRFPGAIRAPRMRAERAERRPKGPKTVGKIF